MVKEEHASKIITTMSEYFLTQKVKDDVPPGDAEYPAFLEKLADHHKILRLAMATKQQVDEAAADKLSDAIHDLGHKYYAE